MRKQSNNYKATYLKQESTKKQEGFSLIEVAVALATMGICLAYAMPLILYSKINNSKSETRTGALMVSQKIFDDIRGRNFIEIPQTDREVTNTNGLPAVAATSTIPALPALPAIPSEQTKALGRDYNVAVRYCQVTSECTENYKTFKVTIRDKIGDQSSDQSIVYEMEAAFTNFK
jgi:prepilin-type N-terminal cleavage/methylation domain-containing protein